MYMFLIPLLLGFSFNLLGAFTATWSRLWGEQAGTLISFVGRGVLGIPLWGTGLFLAFRMQPPAVYTASIWMALLGAACVVASGVILYAAFRTLRSPAMQPTMHDAVVEEGIYARVRHPMDAATIILFAGLFLLRPTPAMALACAIGVVWALLQAWFEELDLLRRIPDYRDYKTRVPRFLPRFHSH